MLENAILYVGIGPNKYALDEIIEENSATEISKNYGAGSCFHEACLISGVFGAGKLFFLNLNTWEDIKKHKDELRGMEIDYVVPLGLYADDCYYDSYYDKNLSYVQLFLMMLNRTISTLVISGRHASLYETLTAYLDQEKKVLDRLDTAINNLSKENLVYVTNNLKNYGFANAVLASVCSVTDYDSYPASGQFGEAEFEIEYCDIKCKTAFFKNNELTGTTIENFINFSDNQTVKLATVNKILHYFRFHGPELDHFIGTAYTEYKKVKIAEMLEEYLESLKGWIITDYRINSITDVTTELGTVDIILNYDIWPRFTTERYRMETGI